MIPLRKIWVRRTDVTYRVNKKTGNLWVDGREIKDTMVLDLYRWLGRYLAYKKLSKKTVSLQELRVQARRVERGLTELIGE